MDVQRQPAGSARELAARLPPGPGVYRFRDGSGRVLYLGRAVSLRRRVASYWATSAIAATWPRWWRASLA